jgi:enoyl-CoA hydratase
MTREDSEGDAVLAALGRANPVPDDTVLDGPDSSRARALMAAITAADGRRAASRGSEPWLLHDHVRVDVHDRVAVLRFDDGKVNVLSAGILEALHEAVDLCEADGEIGALLIVGRTAQFSAGVDRGIFLTSPGAARSVLGSVARLVARMYASTLPVVAACSGNAIAAGALLLLAADVRVAARGGYRIGLNETAIGLPLPRWAAALARERLARQQYQRATLMAHLYSPDEAMGAGFVDRVVAPEDLLATSMREAEELAALDSEAYAATVGTTRGDTMARIEVLIEEDFGSSLDFPRR